MYGRIRNSQLTAAFDDAASPIPQGANVNGNRGVDVFSGLEHFSAHNIPAVSHRIVVASGDGTTVFFQNDADAERYANRIIRRGDEDEVMIFRLEPYKLVKNQAGPRVATETITADGPATRTSAPALMRPLPEGVERCTRCGGTGFIGSPEDSVECTKCDGRGYFRTGLDAVRAGNITEATIVE